MIKKLINTPESCVEEAVEGAMLTDSSLLKVEGLNILVRSDIAHIKSRFVTLISGGGSGHEPAHAGFIGEAMLSAAVLGNVFASPSVASIVAAIRVCAGPRGVLLIVKNYTGDRLNFGMASEIAKQEGVDVMMVIVADDCALPVDKGITGGRGIAGTVLVHKIAGAAAARGACLADVHRLACEAAARIGSLGVALSTCTVPGTPPSTRLSGGLMEVGMGIHGEPGREQMALPAVGAADLVAQLLVDGILGVGRETPRLQHSAGQRVAVLLNNLGAVPVIEMQIVARSVMRSLLARGLVPVRAYVGPYCTSLEMCGVSLSLLTLDDLSLVSLDQHTTAPAWVKSSPLDLNTADISTRTIPYTPTIAATPAASLLLDVGVVGVAQRVCARITELEPLLTQYDAICGDGDCGIVMKKGALRVAADVEVFGSATSVDASAFFTAVAVAVSASMGGTSGALLELCFRAMAASFTKTTQAGAGAGDAQAHWVAAIAAGVEAIQFYGGATVGMRTMLDALVPAVSALQAGEGAAGAAAAATAGMEATKTMQSLAGRSNYVAEDSMNGTPDPGAVAVAEAFSVIAALSK